MPDATGAIAVADQPVIPEERTADDPPAGSPAGRRAALATVGLLSVIGILVLWWRSTQGLLLSQDANFDLRVYHAYNGWALFNEGISKDHHPASSGSYLNPLMDIPTFVAVSLVPSAVGTLLLTIWQLTAAVPLYLIAKQVLPVGSLVARIAITICALGGAVTISEFGTFFGDATLAPLVLMGIYLAILRGTSAAIVSGLLVGAAVGLKLTNMQYALALPILLISQVDRRPATLFRRALWQVLGLGLGFLAFGGVWAAHMWRTQGNPVFPLYNGIFKSPYFHELSLDDERFGASGPLDLLMMPLRMIKSNAMETAELPSADSRWALWLILGIAITAYLCYRALHRREGSQAASVGLLGRQLSALWGYSAAVYVLWALTFGIQRYALALEMLLTVIALTSTYRILERLFAARQNWPAVVRSPTAWVAMLSATLIIVTVPILGWGRIPASWSQPALPLATNAELSSFNTILLPSQPLTYAAVAAGRNASGPVWIGPSWTPADVERGRAKISGSLAALVRIEDPHPELTARNAALQYGIDKSWSCRPIATGMGETNLICVPTGSADPPA